MIVTDAGCPAPARVEPYLLELIASLCGLSREALHGDARLLDIGLDSLTGVSIIAQLEAAYRQKFSEADRIAMLEAETLKDLLAIVSARVG